MLVVVCTLGRTTASKTALPVGWHLRYARLVRFESTFTQSAAVLAQINQQIVQAASTVSLHSVARYSNAMCGSCSLPIVYYLAISFAIFV